VPLRASSSIPVAALGGRRGSVAVEFALIGTCFLMMVLGSIDAARLFFTWEAVDVTANLALREAMLNRSGTTCPSVTTSGIAASVPPILTTSSLTLSASCTTSGGVEKVAVSVTYPFSFVLPWFGVASTTLSSSTSVWY
jgi:Flp pilus assembly protein TadG